MLEMYSVINIYT